MRDSNPRHPRCKRGAPVIQAVTVTNVASNELAVCTDVCTKSSPIEFAKLALDGNDGLSVVLDAWPRLTADIKAGIIALIQAVRGGSCEEAYTLS